MVRHHVCMITFVFGSRAEMRRCTALNMIEQKSDIVLHLQSAIKEEETRHKQFMARLDNNTICSSKV